MKSLFRLCLLSSLAILVYGSSPNKYVELQNGCKMPILGLGTYDSKDTSLEQALEVALESGYRHIDTATYYNNEQVIGQVLSRWFASGKLNRSEIFVVTKLPSIGLRANDVPVFLKQSLELLQLDYVDMYLVHTPFGYKNHGDGNVNPTKPDGNIDLDFTTDLLGVWKAMEEQVDAGRTKSIGLSNCNASQVARVLNNCRIRPQNLQVEIHGYLQQKPLVEFCKQNNIAVTAYSPLGSPGASRLPSQNLIGDPVVLEIAAKHNKSAGQILIRNIIQQGIICIPKSTTPSRIKQNIDVFDFELDDDDVQKLNGLDKGEAGRLLDFRFAKGIENHPEFPFQ